MGLKRVTGRVRTKNRIKMIAQGTGEGGSPRTKQLQWEEGSVVSETERGWSDGSVATREGSDAGLGHGGSGSVLPSFPVPGVAALPFGADGAALPTSSSSASWRPTQHLQGHHHDYEGDKSGAK